jgi:hypothetical protein
MASEERILAYVGFNEERSFLHYLRHLYRFWEAAMDLMYHIVVTDRRLVLVRVSNPFDSFLIGPLLLDGLFYFPRLRWFKDRVLEGRLDKAMETNLKKEVYRIEEVSLAGLDKTTLAIRLKNGSTRLVQLKPLPYFELEQERPTEPSVSAIGGDFPHKANLRAALDEFNTLAAGSKRTTPARTS